MTESAQYAYNPPWWVIAWNSAVSLGAVILVGVGWMSGVFGMVLASISAVLVCLLLSRRILYQRHVELSANTLILPTGFLQLRTAVIPYNRIESLRESRWAFGTVLYICADGQQYEIPCGLRIERNAYVVVRDFLLKMTTSVSPPATHASS